MISGETKLIAQPETQVCQTLSISYYRNIRSELVTQLELLSDILANAQLELQSRLLSIIIYKHKNQLCKFKSLQYARRVVKMIDRVDSKDVKICLDDLSLHLNGVCNCIWSKPSEQSCTGRQMVIANKLTCKAQIVAEALRSCDLGFPWVIGNLKLNTFVTFHVFLLSNFSRARVVLSRIYKEFITAFELMEKLDIVSAIVLDKLSSMRHGFLFEGEMYLKDTRDQIFGNDNAQNSLSNSNAIINMLQGDSKNEKLSGLDLLIPQKTVNQFAEKDGCDYIREEMHQSFSLDEEIKSKVGVCDIGISLPRENGKYLKNTVHSLSPDVGWGHLVKNVKYNQSSPASKLIRQKKAKSRLTRALCLCWKCQQYRRHFHSQRWRKSGFRHMTTKCCIIRKNANLGKKKRRNELLKNDLQEVANLPLKQDIEQVEKQRNATSRSFLSPRLSATHPDDIDLIFDVL